MAQPTWTFYLTDEAGTQLAELTHATDKTLTIGNNTGSVLSFRLPLTHTHASLVSTGDTLVKAYRKNQNGVRTIRFHGQVWSCEYAGNDSLDAMQVVVADPFAVLAHRYTQATFSSVDQGTILKTLVDAANSDQDTRIRTNTANIQASTTRTIDWSTTRKAIAETFTELAEMDAGCDWELRPIEYASGKIVDLYVYATRGTTKNQATFAYGPRTANTVTSMQRTLSLDGMANVVNAYGDPALTVETATNYTSVNTYGQLTADLSYPDVDNQTYLAALATEYLAEHGTPTESIRVAAGRNAPSVWDDFSPGDTVRVHGEKGAMNFTSSMRVDAITVGVDDNGIETTQDITGVVV